jgi:hypothetical protein
MQYVVHCAATGKLPVAAFLRSGLVILAGGFIAIKIYFI